MSSNGAKRPQFFEGQYLGASDLDAMVTYQREQAARHSLAGHTWGIAMGLQLEERETPAGDEVDVYIQPGYAWDGFGRPVVVLAPYKLPPEKCKNCADGQVKVWLYYKQSTTGAPPPGFETCETAEQFARVQESFDVEVGEFSHTQQHDELSIAGESVDAMNSLHNLDDSAPLFCDESIPFQMFPEYADNPRWLIPLGYVNWEKGTHGQAGKFIKTEDTKITDSRKARIYIGAVAENLYAADGVIRLCDRSTLALSSEALSTACDQETFADEDLLFDEEAEVLSVEDLVWVEGNLRAKGDVKLFGTKLDFRDDAGNDGPLWIRRAEENDLSGKDLQVVIGDEGEGENNRFAVGLKGEGDSNSLSTHFIVLGSGNVGIGHDSPEKLLHIQGSEDPTILVETESSGEFSGRLSFRQSDGLGADIYYDDTEDVKGLVIGTHVDDYSNPRLFVKDNGWVGIGTTSPDHNLQIGDAASPVSLSLRGRDDLGHSSVLVFESEYGTVGGWFKIIHDTANSILRFSTSEHDSVLALESATGHVGIGTNNPESNLEIFTSGADGAHFMWGGHKMTLQGVNDPGSCPYPPRLPYIEWCQANGGRAMYLGRGNTDSRIVDLRLENGFDLAILGGGVGIGTESPKAALDVAGRIIREGAEFTVSGSVEHVEYVFVPWGTTDEWNIFVSPRKIGETEYASSDTKEICGVMCWATEINLPSNPTIHKKGWLVTSMCKLSNNTTVEGEANYLLVPK